MKKLSLLLGAMMLLAGCRKNQIPGGASVPSGPEFGRTGGRLRFTSSATDPDSDSVAIRFDWGDGDTSAWSTSVRSRAAVTDSHAWGESDTYLIRAQARREGSPF